MKGLGWGPLTALLVAIWFAYPCLTRSQPYTLLDYADLVFHEAGHAVLAAFVSSPFVVSLGGTLGQLIVPAALGVYFFARREMFSVACMLFWFGQSLVNVSVYMRDARFMLLPLFGGGDDGEGHDWNFLFGQMKLLHKSVAIADFTRVLATLALLAGLGAMGLWLWRQRMGGTARRAGR